MRGQDRFSLRRHKLALAIAGAILLAGTAAALAQMTSELTGPTPPMESVPADRLPKRVVDDVRKMRAYPDQPSTSSRSMPTAAYPATNVNSPRAPARR